MIPCSGPGWRTFRSGPTDAQGAAILLVAVLLAAGTALPQLGTKGASFPPPPIPQTAGPSSLKAGPSQAVPAAKARQTKRQAGEDRSTGPLDVNTANAAGLQTLPGIGPGLAEQIVMDRERNGPFRTPEDLLRVPGIGPKRFERIRPLVRLTEEP
jgi:competence ComEA-like helix-hairpin-helix protein